MISLQNTMSSTKLFCDISKKNKVSVNTSCSNSYVTIERNNNVCSNNFMFDSLPIWVGISFLEFWDNYLNMSYHWITTDFDRIFSFLLVSDALYEHKIDSEECIYMHNYKQQRISLGRLSFHIILL